MGASLLFCIVVGVADGDTLKARCGTDVAGTLTIRLAEVDAPSEGSPSNSGASSIWRACASARMPKFSHCQQTATAARSLG